MLRSMMQCYVKNSAQAVELYQKAFDAKLGSFYQNDDGSFYHAELDVYGQVVAIAEACYGYTFANDQRTTGNTMQFCFHFGEGKEEIVQKAFDVLEDGCQILYPLSACEYSPYMVDFTDKFGIRWCLFV
jgi:PhnB protein